MTYKKEFGKGMKEGIVLATVATAGLLIIGLLLSILGTIFI